MHELRVLAWSPEGEDFIDPCDATYTFVEYDTKHKKILTRFETHGGGNDIAAELRQRLAATKAMWCQCGNPSGDTEFYDDNELCPGDKHHWDCKDCGKLLQIG